MKQQKVYRKRRKARWGLLEYITAAASWLAMITPFGIYLEVRGSMLTFILSMAWLGFYVVATDMKK